MENKNSTTNETIELKIDPSFETSHWSTLTLAESPFVIGVDLAKNIEYATLPSIEPTTDVEILKKEIEELKEENEKLKEEKDRYYKWYMEYLTEKVKYENAFKAVMEELKK